MIFPPYRQIHTGCFLVVIFMFVSISILGQTTVMSFNIRYNNPNDKENAWEHRKSEIVDMLLYYHPNILGIQEGLYGQVHYLDSMLHDYNYVGVGRDDGINKGEYSAIFYDTSTFTLVETKTYWLSKTPEIVSVGWDASMERIATYAVFKNKQTNDSLHVFNCHYDHIGTNAR